MIERRPDGRPAETYEASGEPSRPGGSVFSLDRRPVPGLYFVAWLLCGVAFALVFVGLLAGNPATTPALVLGGFVALIAGLSAAAGYQLVARADRPAGAYRGPAPLILFGIVVALVTVVVGPLVLLRTVDPTTSTGGLVNVSVIAIGYVAVVAIFVVRSGALSWTDMGWPSEGLARIGRRVEDVAVGVAVMPPSVIVVGVVGGLLATLAGVRPESPLPLPRSSAEAVAFVVAAVVVAPIGEELFFRGFALTAWQRDLGPRSALIRSSIFFAAVHLASLSATSARQGLVLAAVTFLIYLPLGLLLGWLFQRRGIVAAIAGHAAANATVVGLNVLAQSFIQSG